ncbi:MAG TPA: MFS transporter [Solirubrobacteraceae bacterium]|nr:MFS transporter [Solirubrobacteraceae bacterium]
MRAVHPERTHPTLILAVLSLGGAAYAMLSSSVVPALPTLQIVARFIQGAAGGIFPLAFGIVRDEFPHEKVAGSIGLLSAILGVGAGIGIVLSGVIVEHLTYHWLFWLPLIAILLAAFATWRYIPESPVRVPGRISARFGSRSALLAGTAFTTCAFALLAVAHAHPYDLLIAAGLLGIGIGLAFAALGNLIVQAQTGVASGMNTVMRTLGGALGGQLSATFIAGHVAHGQPTVTGFTDTFLMATGFLLVCLAASALVPSARLVAAMGGAAGVSAGAGAGSLGGATAVAGAGAGSETRG